MLSGLLLFLSFPKFGHGPWPGSPCAAAGGARGRLGLAGPPPGLRDRRVSSLGLLYWTALVVMQYGGLRSPSAPW